jgi:hypothetical protein
MAFGGAQAIFGTPSQKQSSTTSYQVGQVVGDAISTGIGIVEVGVAFTGEVGGTILSATGVGAFVGVPVVAGSTALGLHGGASVINGISNGFENTVQLFNGRDPSKPANSTSSSNTDSNTSGSQGTGSTSSTGPSVTQGTEKGQWYKADGSLNYPPNNGAILGTEVPITLEKGQTLGRYGNVSSTSDYVTAPGASPSSLSLPPSTNSSIYTEYVVVKPIPKTVQSEVAPWGGDPGGGLQYKLPMPISELIEKGYIKPVGT